jgi:hypothetical protein
MIPPGVIRGLAGTAVGLIRSPLWQPQRRIDASGLGLRDAREIIRLKSSSVSTHEIARRLGLARSTVRETLKRVEGAGLSWPLPEEMNDEALEAALYASRRTKRGHRRIEEPDWAGVHHELKRKHVTLLILWDEYIAATRAGTATRTTSSTRAARCGSSTPTRVSARSGRGQKRRRIAP